MREMSDLNLAEIMQSAGIKNREHIRATIEKVFKKHVIVLREEYRPMDNLRTALEGLIEQIEESR